VNEAPPIPITWRSNLRAVLAIAKKDLLVFFRYPLNAVFGIVESVVWLVPVYFLGRAFATPSGNLGFAAYTGSDDYVSFILIGTVLSSYVSAVFWGMGYSLKQEMDSGVLESNWMTPLSRLLLLIGRTVASLAITTLNTVAVLVLGGLLFGFRVTGDVLAAAATVVPMVIALYGFGFAFAALVLILRDANTLVDVSSYLVIMLSGGRFPVQALPWFVLPIALIIPLTYGFDAVRGLLLNTTTLLPVAYEVAILLTFMVLMVPSGYAIFRLVERRCKKVGTLGMH
jgi:ABC-2 type transport system permease protein